VSYISRHSRAVTAASEASGDSSVQLPDQRAVMGGRRGLRLKGLILTARGVHLV